MRKKKSLALEVAGLNFTNPVGLLQGAEGLRKCPLWAPKAGFIVATPPWDNLIDWITKLQDFTQQSIIAVNLRSDIVRSFSLLYDFAHFIIIDPDSNNGIRSADISDITELIDEIVSLRLCYERYTPIFLRLTNAETPDELHPLCNYARMSGLDGLVAPDPARVRMTLEECQHRMPVIGVAQNAEEALQELQDGASLVQTELGSLALRKLLRTLEKPSKE
jgi:hypothetical protein